MKALYAGRQSRCEQQVDGYRIDAVRRGKLIEIQQSSLSALRDKVRELVAAHAVVVVKPLFAKKVIVRRDPETQAILSQRCSPNHETVWDLFLDLVHFTHVFPHPRLTLEVLLVDIEEHRVDKPKRRWNRGAFRVVDRQLTSIGEKHVFRTADDLLRLLPVNLPAEFTTAELAAATNLPRWWAQKVAYCLREIEAIETLGKRRHAWLYGWNPSRRAA